MWVLTTAGFYSAVQHRQHRDRIIVRARDRADLVRLQKLLPGFHPIQDTPKADYPHRIEVSRTQWERTCGQMARGIDYDNFKNAVTKTLGHHRHMVLLRVWSALRELTPGTGLRYPAGQGKLARALEDQANELLEDALDRTPISYDYALHGLPVPAAAREKHPQDVPCPTCGALVNRACLTIGGHWTRHYHRDRRIRARARQMTLEA